MVFTEGAVTLFSPRPAPSLQAGYVTITVPVIILAGTLFGAQLRALSSQAKKASAAATAQATEVLGNIRTVRAFATEDWEMAAFQKHTARTRERSERLGLGIGLFLGASNMFTTGVVLSVLYYGGRC